MLLLHKTSCSSFLYARCFSVWCELEQMCSNFSHRLMKTPFGTRLLHRGLHIPRDPAGFACKNPSKVMAKDFVFSGLGRRTNTSTIIKAGVAGAYYNTFPSVNGLGLALARADLEAGGVIPLHTHPRGSEILLTEGTLESGIIDGSNSVYLPTLKKGDLMVYPHGLLHFQYNKPYSKPATFFVGFNSDSPGIQFVPFNLFGNNFPTDLMSANTFITPAEIKRLKALFGGNG